MAQPRSTHSNLATLYLVAIQVTSRLLTFVGNQFLLRYVSPALLGLAVQLELLSVTILYSSRECLRVALQRSPISVKPSTVTDRDQATESPVALQMQEAVNVSYIVMVIGVFNSLLFGYGYLRKASTEVLQAQDFKLALACYAAATFLELCAEPCFVVIQQQSLYKARAKAETMAAISKCLGACVVAFCMSRYDGTASVRPFAIGQSIYALILVVWYLWAVIPVAGTIGFTLLLRRITARKSSDRSYYWMGYFSKSLLNWTFTFYGQSIFKLFLTQGDSLILSFVADLQSQGAFALASNYGGLLSRLLFQPVEESSRNVFGQLLAPVPNKSLINKSDSNQVSVNNERKSSRSESTVSRQTNIDTALVHLSTTLHLYALFTLPLLVLLPHVFPVLVSNLVGSRWSTPATTHLLSAYAYYLPFLAINGVLDAFVTSAATPKQLRNQNLIMIIVTLIYGSIAWILMADRTTTKNLSGTRSLNLSHLAMGPAGLVWANIVNMTLRIAYSIWFIKNWIDANIDQKTNPRISNPKTFWHHSIPHVACMLTALAAALGLAMKISSNPRIDAVKSIFGLRGLDGNDVILLTSAGVMILTSLIRFEHEFLLSTVESVLPDRYAKLVKRAVYTVVPAPASTPSKSAKFSKYGNTQKT